MIRPIALEVTLDRPRSLVFTKRARVLVEREVNRWRGADQRRWASWNDLCSNLTLDVTYAIIWASALEEDPGLRFDDAVRFLSEIDDDHLISLVLQIFATQFPKKAEGEGESPPPLDPTRPSSATGVSH